MLSRHRLHSTVPPSRRLLSPLFSRFCLPAALCLLVLSALPSYAAPPTLAPSSIFRLTASQFEEPFLATAPTTAQDDAALQKAVERYRGRTVEDDFSAMNGYLAASSQSGWRVAVLTNLGLSYYHDGYFSKAIDSWEQAWREGKRAEDQAAKPIVDRAAGELLRMHARLGHADRIEALLKDIGDRPLTGPATEALTGAKEGLWMMQHEPGTAYLCGPMALRNLLLLEGAKRKDLAFLDSYRSGPHGVSLEQVAALAAQAHFTHEIVFRRPGQPIPVPSIVHWKVSHFAAIVGHDGDRFHIQDPTFGRDLWISRNALESESSGYFLVPVRQEASLVWRPVGNAEAGQVRGMGFTSFQQFGANLLSELKKAFGTCSSGMCVANTTMLTVGVHLEDTPVGYSPPKGPDAHIKVVYNQREDSQPATFGWFNVSPKWTLTALAYIQDDPGNEGGNVMRYAAGGGSVAYTDYVSATGAFDPETRDASVLVRTSSSPLTYERRLQDGSKEVYARSNGATSYPRRVFLTQMVDRFGNASTYSYDAQLRLTSITDATSRQTTFSYGLTAQPLLVTKITDPFGRSALLVYDTSNRLSQITDVLGLVSKFTYDASGLINALTTPYGKTSFVYGDDGTTRFVNTTDPLGYTDRVEFQHQAPGIAYNDPDNTVPAGLDLCNCYLYYRDSYYWDKHMYLLTGGDYTQARITHFHHWITDANETAHSVESIKLPLENRISFTYTGQDYYGSIYSGSYDRPTAIARVLDDGTSQETKLTYNAQGNVIDSIDPAGRETQFAYAANGIDVTGVKQKTSASGYSTLATMTYNSQHLPLTSTDAAGQTTTYTYNNAGQPLTKTDALEHVTTFNYDGQGYLISVVNANNKTQVSFTYDGFGRVDSRTDSEGRTVTYQYDALDRPTIETYPDGTTRRNSYNRLDLAAVTDRQGRTTTFSYDANRQLIQITDPLQRKTKFTYYENGTRKSLTDPNGHKTSWTIDLESRVTGKTYADGKGWTDAYEATTSRLKSVTDALGQKKQYRYTIDNRLAGIAYSNVVNSTPSVSWKYDPYFARPVSMTDGSGATAYTYQPLGALGALELAQADGPYNNDTIGYAYDALGRPVTRTVGGSPETFSYDAINRPTTEGNALGTFNLSYLGQTEQLTSQLLQGGAVGTSWAYDTNENDRRLKAIINSGATRSYQLSTTPEDDITKISEIAGAGSAFPSETWSYGFDDSSRLTAATSSLGKAYSYGYDDADNITSQQTATGSTSLSYNTLNQVAGDSYDANGNLLDDGQRTYTWDAENRLLSVTLKTQAGKVTTFRYDGYGRRIVIITNGTEVRYLWCGQQLCQARSSADVVTRRYFAQGELIPASGTELYYAQDQLGSVRDVVTVQNGARVASYDYEPYGNPSQTAGRIGTDFRFAHLFYEPNSGLYLSNSRAYDPRTGRWISRDHLQEAGGLNLYSYVGGQVLTSIDPLGTCLTRRDQAVLAGAALVAAAAAAVVASDGLAAPVAAELAAEGLASIEGAEGVAAVEGAAVESASTILSEGAAATGESGVAAGADGVAAEASAEGGGNLVTVVHYTDEAGMNAITGAGELRSGTFVTLPSETSGLSSTEIETRLEIEGGRGTFSTTFQTSPSNLTTPFNGPTTSGGAVQFQLKLPVSIGPGSFLPTL